ncbi:MAG TPA: zf-HC2 domain-containing protein [Terriglobia bacterium]|nr:zf-HC2 domain-containing protein [Terriglobia bacterium]
MKCVDREKIFLYFHQVLEPDEADRVRRHVAGCEGCARKAEEYRRLDSALDDWTAAEPSPWFDAKVVARVGANENRNSGFFGFGRVRMLVAAVAAMALIIVAVVVFNHSKVAEINHPASSQQQPVASAASSQVSNKMEALKKPLPAEEQLKMDENLSVLEDYEVVANFDALSELPQANAN